MLCAEPNPVCLVCNLASKKWRQARGAATIKLQVQLHGLSWPKSGGAAG